MRFSPVVAAFSDSVVISLLSVEASEVTASFPVVTYGRVAVVSELVSSSVAVFDDAEE